uniref:C2H2-type domain-containing protein n=1 Tax=Anguilla anguilla TaxID=7936 RepID=A0A0E9TBX0_ANGAN
MQGVLRLITILSSNLKSCVACSRSFTSVQMCWKKHRGVSPFKMLPTAQ